jgi:hypothetical protein
MPTKVKRIMVERDVYFYSFSFDIDDFIGDGIWWLQIYDNQRRMIYDKPFASSQATRKDKLNFKEMRKIIKDDFQHKGWIVS